MALPLFVSYSTKDKTQLEKLETHLLPFQRRGQLSYSHLGMTPAGTEWQKWRSDRLAQAQLIVCLVSADYLADLDDELIEIFRQKARGAVIVPVLVRPAILAGSLLEPLQPLPSNGKPVSQWSSTEDAWLDVVQALWGLVQTKARSAATDSGQQSATKPQNPDPPASPSALTKPKVRSFLGEVLRTDSDLEAFCLDYFSTVKGKFTNGMERSQKVNFLLDGEDLEDIVKALKQAEPRGFAKHQHLLF